VNRVLISVRHLVDRMRYPRTRADELAALRARFRAQPTKREASRERIAAAERLRELRIAMSEALGSVEACHVCAKGHPQPWGRWDGGHCCGGRTLDIWSPDEVAALKLGGTDIAKASAPRDDHAGCVFRGPTGCSLAAADRPTICVRYLCLDLRAELRARIDWQHVSAIASELRDTFRRFEALSENR
jgi:hypothetical protein